MFAWKNKKKLAGAIALFAVCGLTLGCDDYHDRPHHRPPPEDRHGHRPPHDGRYAHRPPRDGNQHHRGENGRHGHNHRRHAAMVGAYSARALNDAVLPKGTTISLNVVQAEDDSLRLVAPTGKQYPIQFDAETGAGYIAGGTLSLREDGLFVYQDAKSGVWLVERQ